MINVDLLASSFSLSRFCELVCPYLSSDLIGQEYKTRFLQYASLLPSDIDIGCVFFECSLKGEERWGDLLFVVNHPFTCMEAFDESSLKESYQWKNICLFYEQWRKNELFRKRKIDQIWIELDIGSSSIWPSEPNIFLDKIGVNHEMLCETADQAYFALKKKRLTPEALSLLQKCKSEGSEVFSLGFMLARPSDAIRIAMVSRGLFDASFFGPFLSNLDYPALEDNLISILKKIQPYFHRVNLEIDITDRVLPRICFSCHIQKKDISADKETWNRCLDFLVSEQIVDKDRQNALIAWCGCQFASVSEPDSLFYESFPHQIISRSINHIKFLYVPGKPITAKIYLAVISETIS